MPTDCALIISTSAGAATFCLDCVGVTQVSSKMPCNDLLHFADHLFWDIDLGVDGAVVHIKLRQIEICDYKNVNESMNFFFVQH